MKISSLRHCVLLLLGILAPSSALAQDAYGLGNGSDGAYTAATATDVVNTYAALTAASSGATITVTSSTGFAATDLVMVWQVQGGPFTSGDGAPVDLAARGLGQFELARVVSTTATTLVLDHALTTTYAATGAQVVRIPEYTTVTIAASRAITARPWDGATGGIAAFLATGTVTSSGAVDVTGYGFRGGSVSVNLCFGACACNAAGMTGPLDDFTCDGRTGFRGEGLDRSAGAFGATGCGIGNRASGGGGGGSHNAGGSGGGNGGSGSVGGTTWCTMTDFGGRPTARVTGTVPARLTLGGGGGGGQQNNLAGSTGAPGGGVIFVRARSIAGLGRWIASGGYTTGLNNDGQGGGGAGGTIYLQAVESIACDRVTAAGSSGGSTGGHGGGGGGGGGRIHIDARTSTCTDVFATAGLGGTGHTFPGGGTGEGQVGVVEARGTFGCRTGADCTAATPICDPVAFVCRVSPCGDGVTGGSEACDDGNTVSGDGCTSVCTREAGFTCGGMPSVCVRDCGNGIIAGGEACDDGNATAGDGCTGCAIDPGFTCTGAPSTCTSRCGDGVRVGTEGCDDGNTTAGDGCSGTCTTEAGYACMGSPSACSTVCGDGRVVGTEGCDDGNTTAGDGCGSACGIEAGFRCMGAPSVCTSLCAGVMCDDMNACTLDSCSLGVCSNMPSAGAMCDDGNACTSGDVCSATGTCAGTGTCDDAAVVDMPDAFVTPDEDAGTTTDDAGTATGDDAAVVVDDDAAVVVMPDAAMPPGRDAGRRVDAGSGDRDTGSTAMIDAGAPGVGAGPPVVMNGCNCRVQGSSAPRGAMLAALVTLGLALATRRRRR